MEEKVKKKTTFWLPPDMIDRMDGWLKADNCRSRNEFVEKALRFYMGYLGTEDNTAYLSQAILTAIQGTRTVRTPLANQIIFPSNACEAKRSRPILKESLSASAAANGCQSARQ